MKKTLYFAYGIVLICSILASYFIFSLVCSSKKIHSKQIALFVPAVHPAMRQITEGFIQTLQTDDQQYQFITYNAQGNKTLLRAQAEDIVSKNYDLIFTVGTACTHIMYELTRKKNLSTPVVFTAIDDPVELGIVDSLASSGNNLTGIINPDNFALQFIVLVELKPSIRKVLFVYDPTHGKSMHTKRDAIQQTLAQFNIPLQCVEIYQSNELQTKIQALLPTVDVVFVYTDHTIVASIETLVTLCNRYNVTLYASDLNSGAQGAALAFGCLESDHGKYAAYKASQILTHHKQPSELEITTLQEYKLNINPITMQQQNILITPKQITALQAKGITIQGVENV